MKKHVKCGLVFLVLAFLFTGCAKHNETDSMDKFIKQNVTFDKSTELESYEWIKEEEVFRVKVKYREQLENAYLHKEDYFFFFEDEELVQTVYVDYPTKDYENIDKDRYVGDACNFEAHMEDVTFDGNNDLIISLGHFGVHGTEVSCAYIYTTEGYRYEPTFEDIPAYEADEENQVIKGCNVDSASRKSEYIYKYENNEFVQKEHTSYEDDCENAWKSVSYSMYGEDGEWDIVNTTYYYYDDNNFIISEKTYRNDSQDIKDLEGEVEYLYDDKGHLIEKNTYQCFNGEKGSEYGHETYTYDEHGNCIRKNVYDSRDEIARYTIEDFMDICGTGEYSRVSSFEYNSNGQVSFGFEDTYEQSTLIRRDYYNEKGMSKYTLYDAKKFSKEEKGVKHTTTDVMYDMNGKVIGKTVTEYGCYAE